MKKYVTVTEACNYLLRNTVKGVSYNSETSEMTITYNNGAELVTETFTVGGGDTTELEEAIEQLQENLGNKQDKLTAGAGITIDENNEISCSVDTSNFVPKTKTDGSAKWEVIDSKVNAQPVRTLKQSYELALGVGNTAGIKMNADAIKVVQYAGNQVNMSETDGANHGFEILTDTSKTTSLNGTYKEVIDGSNVNKSEKLKKHLDSFEYSGMTLSNIDTELENTSKVDLDNLELTNGSKAKMKFEVVQGGYTVKTEEENTVGYVGSPTNSTFLKKESYMKDGNNNVLKHTITYVTLGGTYIKNTVNDGTNEYDIYIGNFGETTIPHISMFKNGQGIGSKIVPTKTAEIIITFTDGDSNTRKIILECQIPVTLIDENDDVQTLKNILDKHIVYNVKTETVNGYGVFRAIIYNALNSQIIFHYNNASEVKESHTFDSANDTLSISYSLI